RTCPAREWACRQRHPRHPPCPETGLNLIATSTSVCGRGRRFQCFLSGVAVVIEVLRLPLQDCIEAVEDRHPLLEQLMIVLCALRKPLHGEVEAERLVPRELA